MSGVEKTKKVKDARRALVDAIDDMSPEHAELVLNYMKAQDSFDAFTMELLLGLSNQLNEKK